MKALTLYHMYVHRIVAALAVVCAISVFLYGAFLLMAVAHATHMAGAERQIKTLTGQLSVAESQYLAMTDAISPATAIQLGLVKPATIAIVEVAKAQGLSINR
jgi:hypothetical protein